MSTLPRSKASRGSAGTRSRAYAKAQPSGAVAARHDSAEHRSEPSRPESPWLQAWSYQADFLQRSVLFLDTLRQRGENLLAHEKAGLPPLLAFEYETVLDARQFEHPANYALFRVIGHRDDDSAQPTRPCRPVIIFDPRAGHGPGIGGFKGESEVGMALEQGYPVYFVAFFPDPCPGQSLADVHHALRRFVAEVARRHAGQPPVLYGNCQAGWAVVLLSADCVGTAGLAVLNGSPLSYWAGAPEVNPMRLAGGLSGGAWAAHMAADASDGYFDGAWLALNFELLNPALTLWEKNYQLFANVDTERERFLQFERWWSGYYRLSREEIVAIVENLFIGNKLEQGLMRICEHCVADLKRIRNPILVFASSADNITPPHQALNWVPVIYPTTQALKAAGQRVVYLLNPHVGHLGIFVSADVARREHRAILGHVDELEALAPGLYEMKIVDGAAATGSSTAPRVEFHPRRVEDLRYDYPRKAFERARDLSELNELLYRAFLSPLVRATSSPWSAELLKWLHPMQWSRYLCAERYSPWMASIRMLASLVEKNRNPVANDNPYLALERVASEDTLRALETYRKARDSAYEAIFAVFFEQAPAGFEQVAAASKTSSPLRRAKRNRMPRLLVETDDPGTNCLCAGMPTRTGVIS